MDGGRMSRHPLPREIMAEIAERRHAGETLTALAWEYGTTDSHVAAIARRAAETREDD
jgi:transcriptional regulator